MPPEPAYVTWTALGLILSLVGAIPSTLLVWLHVRMNAIARQQRDDCNGIRQQCLNDNMTTRDRIDLAHRQVEVVKSEILSAVERNYITRLEVAARFDAVVSTLTNITDRLGLIASTGQQSLERVSSLGERVAGLEAQLQTTYRK